MKIAVSSTGKNLTSEVSEIFARCPYFIIADVEDNKIQKIETIENVNANQFGQAGIFVAQLMAEKNIKAVITKNIGPRALDALKQFNITIYFGDGTIKNVFQDFVDGKLKENK